MPMGSTLPSLDAGGMPGLAGITTVPGNKSRSSGESCEGLRVIPLIQQRPQLNPFR